MIRYRERLTPSRGIHAALVLLVPLGFGMLAPLNIVWGIISAIVWYGLGLAIFIGFAPVVEVSDDSFRAGRARIDRRFVGKVTVVEAENRVTEFADARAWLLVRGWLPRGIRVTLTDPADPTPYWYVSSRSPEKLREALREKPQRAKKS